MAEFLEVIKQANRLCKAYVDCSDCTLGSSSIGCAPICDECYTDAALKEFEQTVMQWAKEHPEPRYPTWEEWYKESFPNSISGVHPCDFIRCDEFLGCDACKDQPIPAGIAKKLGVSPKEG